MTNNFVIMLINCYKNIFFFFSLEILKIKNKKDEVGI